MENKEVENKIILITSYSQFVEFFNPFLRPLVDKLDMLTTKSNGNITVYNEEQAADYLRCSKKKLQNLRNKRKIGFIRQEGGRGILYKKEHLLDYLNQHELKKKSK